VLFRSDFLIEIQTDDKRVEVDTRQIKEIVGQEGYLHPEVIRFIKDNIESEIEDILKGGI